MPIQAPTMCCIFTICLGLILIMSVPFIPFLHEQLKDFKGPIDPIPNPIIKSLQKRATVPPHYYDPCDPNFSSMVDMVKKAPYKVIKHHDDYKLFMTWVQHAQLYITAGNCNLTPHPEFPLPPSFGVQKDAEEQHKLVLSNLMEKDPLYSTLTPPTTTTRGPRPSHLSISRRYWDPCDPDFLPTIIKLRKADSKDPHFIKAKAAYLPWADEAVLFIKHGGCYKEHIKFPLPPTYDAPKWAEYLHDIRSTAFAQINPFGLADALLQPTFKPSPTEVTQRIPITASTTESTVSTTTITTSTITSTSTTVVNDIICNPFPVSSEPRVSLDYDTMTYFEIQPDNNTLYYYVSHMKLSNESLNIFQLNFTDDPSKYSAYSTSNIFILITYTVIALTFAFWFLMMCWSHDHAYVFEQYYRDKATRQYLEDMFPPNERRNVDLEAAAYLHCKFPESQFNNNAMFHAYVQMLNKVGIDFPPPSNDNDYTEIDEIDIKSKSCSNLNDPDQFVKEPHMYIILPTIILRVSSTKIEKVVDKDLAINLAKIFTDIPCHFRCDLNGHHVHPSLIRRIEQMYDTFVQSPDPLSIKLSDLNTRDYVYSEAEQKRFVQNLDDRTISISSLYAIPHIDDGIMQCYHKEAKKNPLLAQWMKREYLLHFVDEYEVEEMERNMDYFYRPHPQLLGAGPPPDPEDFHTSKEYLHHINLWAHGKHPYLRRSRMTTIEYSDVKIDSTKIPKTYHQVVQNLTDLSTEEKDLIWKLSAWYSYTYAPDSSLITTPEILHAPVPNLPEVRPNNPNDKAEFFRRLRGWLELGHQAYQTSFVNRAEKLRSRISLNIDPEMDQINYDENVFTLDQLDQQFIELQDFKLSKPPKPEPIYQNATAPPPEYDDEFEDFPLLGRPHDVVEDPITLVKPTTQDRETRRKEYVQSVRDQDDLTDDEIANIMNGWDSDDDNPPLSPETRLRFRAVQEGYWGYLRTRDTPIPEDEDVFLTYLNKYNININLIDYNRWRSQAELPLGRNITPAELLEVLDKQNHTVTLNYKTWTLDRILKNYNLSMTESVFYQLIKLTADGTIPEGRNSPITPSWSSEVEFAERKAKGLPITASQDDLMDLPYDQFLIKQQANLAEYGHLVHYDEPPMWVPSDEPSHFEWLHREYKRWTKFCEQFKRYPTISSIHFINIFYGRIHPRRYHNWESKFELFKCETPPHLYDSSDSSDDDDDWPNFIMTKRTSSPAQAGFDRANQYLESLGLEPVPDTPIQNLPFEDSNESKIQEIYDSAHEKTPQEKELIAKNYVDSLGLTPIYEDPLQKFLHPHILSDYYNQEMFQIAFHIYDQKMTRKQDSDPQPGLQIRVLEHPFPQGFQATTLTPTLAVTKFGVDSKTTTNVHFERHKQYLPFDRKLHGYEKYIVPAGNYISIDLTMFKCDSTACTCKLHNLLPYTHMAIFVPNNTGHPPSIQLLDPEENFGTLV